MSLEPGSSFHTLPRDILEALKKVQEEAARQQVLSRHSNLKYPAGPSPVMEPLQMPRSISQLPQSTTESVAHPSTNIPNDQWKPTYQSPVLLQLNSAMRQENPHGMAASSANPAAIMNPQPGSGPPQSVPQQEQVITNPVNMLNQNTADVTLPDFRMNVEPLQNYQLGTNYAIRAGGMALRNKLVRAARTLRQACYKSHQEQIMPILKSDPRLMAAYMKQRQKQQEQEEQQRQQQQAQQEQQVGTNNTTQPSSVAQRYALSQLLQSLRQPSPSRDCVMQILKTHPQIMAAFIKQRQKQQEQQRQQQQAQQEQQRQQQQAQQDQQVGAKNTIRPSSVVPRNALSQLLRALRQPNPSRDYAMQILKTHPQIMAEFIEQRQKQQEQQLQQQQSQQPSQAPPSQPSPLQQQPQASQQMGVGMLSMQVQQQHLAQAASLPEILQQQLVNQLQQMRLDLGPNVPQSNQLN